MLGVLVALSVCLLLLLPGGSVAQTVTGSVTGAIVDASGASVPAASVSLVSETTGDARELKTAADGSFVFSGVFPARYLLRLQAQGFKRLEWTNFNITASERLALGQVALEVGATSESVTAEGALVQAQSQGRSAVLITDKENS